MYELRIHTIHKTHAYELEDSQSSQNPCCSSKRDDAIVQPVVDDPVDDDIIFVEAGAEPTPAPCKPSECQKVKHNLTLIPLKPWLIPRFRGNDVSPLHRAMGGPYRGMLLEFGESVLAHLPEVGKGSGNPAPKLAYSWTSIWSELTKELYTRTKTRRAQQDRRKPSSSCWNTTEAEVDDSGHPSCSRTSHSSSCTTRSTRR